MTDASEKWCVSVTYPKKLIADDARRFPFAEHGGRFNSSSDCERDGIECQSDKYDSVNFGEAKRFADHVFNSLTKWPDSMTGSAFAIQLTREGCIGSNK